MGFETVEEIGARYGRLTVVERAQKRANEGSALWRCRCDCGKETITRGWMLRAGKAKSCGCIRRENFRYIQLAPGVAALNRALSQTKRNAKTRGLDWQLTDADALSLMKSNCFYCDVPPDNFVKHHRSTGGAAYNGI